MLLHIRDYTHCPGKQYLCGTWRHEDEKEKIKDDKKQLDKEQMEMKKGSKGIIKQITEEKE